MHNRHGEKGNNLTSISLRARAYSRPTKSRAKDLKLKQRIYIYEITRIASISSMRTTSRYNSVTTLSRSLSSAGAQSQPSLAVIFCKRGSSRGIGFPVNHCGRHAERGRGRVRDTDEPRSAKLKLCRLASRPHRRYRFLAHVALIITGINDGRCAPVTRRIFLRKCDFYKKKKELNVAPSAFNWTLRRSSYFDFCSWQIPRYISFS